MAQDDRLHLVIIGSGWAGYYIAQYIDTAKYRVSVISPRRTSAYTPLLASAACGLFPFSCAEESVRAKGGHYDFVKANALAVDFDAKRVQCEAAFDDDISFANRSFSVEYDRLVICPGCQTNTFGTPGVNEHGLFVKHVSDAMALRKKLFDQLEKASLPCVSREEAAALLHVAIVGGGPTGVEITAELTDLSRRELRSLYPSVAPFLRITIFDVAPHILGVYDRKLYEYATERMIEHGVNIATSSAIEKVDATALHIKGQAPIPYGILLWVAGNKSVPLIDGLNARKSEKGLVRVLTDSQLRVRKAGESTVVSGTASGASYADVHADVYALGDAADVEGVSLPTTAEVAVQKAKYLVDVLNASGEAAKPFAYKSRRLVTYLGAHDGIAQGLAVDGPWSGRQAWISWRSGSFTWTRSWRNWIVIVVASVLNALFGRDVMRL